MNKTHPISEKKRPVRNEPNGAHNMLWRQSTISEGVAEIRVAIPDAVEFKVLTPSTLHERNRHELSSRNRQLRNRFALHRNSRRQGREKRKARNHHGSFRNGKRLASAGEENQKHGKRLAQPALTLAMPAAIAAPAFSASNFNSSAVGKGLLSFEILTQALRRTLATKEVAIRFWSLFISSRLSFSAAQVSPTIGEIGAEFFAGDGTLGGAVDVDAALGRDRANAVDPLMHHGRRCADYARQLGLASEYFRCFLNMGICHNENIVKQRSPLVKPCLL